MEKPQKIILSIAWGVVAVFGIVTFILWTRLDNRATAAVPVGEGALPVLYEAPAFELTNQDGQSVSDKDLRGSAYVAAFIFTNCAGPCPMMSRRMGQLQKDIANPNVKIVSFTLDPERDTPEVLKKYAQQFSADPARWHFLTGERQKIYDVANGMHLTANPATEAEPIIHSTKFLLIDPNGKVRGVYSNEDPQDLIKLAADATQLVADLK